MSRDHSQLKVFHMADELVPRVYRATLGSASELRYLLGLSQRLDLLSKTEYEALDVNCAALIRSLQRLVDSLAV